MKRIACAGIAVALLCPVSSVATTPGQAYHKATQFLHAQGAAGWESAEARPVLLGEAVAGDPLAAGPRSTTLLASLEVGSVDARARRARVLGSLGLAASADANALLAAQQFASGFGVSAEHLPAPLDTALAIQALDIAGSAYAFAAAQAAFNSLRPEQLPSGMWRLLRVPDAAGGGAAGDVATTAQAVLALKPRKAEPAHTTVFSNAITALRTSAPTRASDRALRLLALLEWDPTHADSSSALTQLVAMQTADGSFGSEPLAPDRVYATALAARAIKRAGQFSNFAFDSDGDGITDGPDPNSDIDALCDPGESGAGCSGSDAFPTDPASGRTSTSTGSGTTRIWTTTATGSPTGRERDHAARAGDGGELVATEPSPLSGAAADLTIMTRSEKLRSCRAAIRSTRPRRSSARSCAA